MAGRMMITTAAPAPSPRSSVAGRSSRTALTPTKITLVPNSQELAAAAAAVVLGAAAVASPAMAYDVELGASVFSGNCAACHTGGKNVVDASKTLEKEALEKYLAGGFNIDAIKYQVENGKGGMPAWKDRLDEDEIEAVANYVYDQALNNGW